MITNSAYPTAEDSPVPHAERIFLQYLADRGMSSAAEGLSQFVGEPIVLVAPRVEVMPVYELPNAFGSAESVCVGIYLAFDGDLAGHVMLLLSRENALELVTLLMSDLRRGAEGLGALERSALAEIGNLTASLFLNSVAEITGQTLRPSPPAVMEDMVGAILDIVAVSTGQLSEHVLLLETAFQRRDRRVQVLFWVIPDAAALSEMARRRTQEAG